MSVEDGMGQKKEGSEEGKKTESEGRKREGRKQKKGAVGVGGEVGVRGVVWLVS